VVTLGVGTADTLDAVTITWPDGRVQAFRDVATDQRLVAQQQEATPPGPETPPLPAPPEGSPANQLFADVTGEAGLDFTHSENRFVDFNREPLIPKKVSTEGPHLATADVNGDGLEDLYIGGAKEQAGRLLVQQPDGRYAASSTATFEADRIAEDVGAAFFDADGDGDQDLYVVSGGNAFSPGTPALQDRLYLNTGGQFERARTLPSLTLSGSCVRPADYDGDGDTDLFVGGRVVPWRYGLTPQSVLLENDGAGQFRVVTEEVAPGLSDIGMVTDAVWADVDGDRRDDLIVVGDWMPIAVFRNTGGEFERAEAPGLEASHGWWNRIVAEDMDGDGDTDFVAGNLGLNTRLHASEDEPATMHVSDFDGNGYIEQVVSYYKNGTSYPLVLRGPLVGQLSYLRQKYTSHAAYAEQTVQDIFTEEQLQEATVHKAHRFASTYIENRGDGTFAMHALPFEAQIAPMYGVVTDDVDGDGHTDILMAGNFHGVPPNIGRMDASYGVWLRGDGDGGFTTVPARESGFRVTDQARDMALVDNAQHGKILVVAKNDAPLQVFTHRR
jgi:hypothetical protein